jgi:hypothetical protein
MAGIESGVNDGSMLTVDPLSKAARVTLYDDDGAIMVYADGDQPASPKGIISMGVNDGLVLPIRMDRFGSTAIAQHQVLFTESFEGTTINPQRWQIVATTMAATQATISGVVFNSGNILTINTGYMLKTTRKFLMTQRQPMQFKFRTRLESYNNSVIEVGIGDATTFNGAHSTGAFIQVTSGGVIQPVLFFNGNPRTGVPIVNLNPNDYYTIDIFKDDDQISFSIQNTGTGEIIDKQTIRLGVDTQRLFSATELSIFSRVYTTGVAPVTAPHLILTDVYASVLDANYNLITSTMQTLQQRSAIHNPFTGVQLAQFGNSVQPASATLSNTAASYATLGGKFQFAAPAGAVTDFALFGFNVPDPATLVVTSIDIESWNTGAAVATTATLLEWFVVENQAAVTLATATGRVGIGAQSFPVGAAIGALGQRLSKQYQGGLVTGPGRFFVIGLRIPIGTATGSQIISGQVNIEGYFL